MNCWLTDGDVTDDRDPWSLILANATRMISGDVHTLSSQCIIMTEGKRQEYLFLVVFFSTILFLKLDLSSFDFKFSSRLLKKTVEVGKKKI